MPCRFASSGTVATSRSASRAILALNAASNFLRDLVISVLHRLRQSRTLHTLTFGPISGVHFTPRALATPEASACGYLAGLIDKAPPGPLFLPSYPTVESGPLHGAAYLYDNAVAAIALVGCGEQDKAYRIGSAILWAIDNDRTWHDGRLRNAYAAGVVANGPVKLPGCRDNTQNKGLEDRYQVGSDNGNNAWALLAWLLIDDVSASSRSRDGAARLGTCVAQWADTR